GAQPDVVPPLRVRRDRGTQLARRWPTVLADVASRSVAASLSYVSRRPSTTALRSPAVDMERQPVRDAGSAVQRMSGPMARDAFAESNQLTDLIPSPTVRTGRVFMAGNAG